MEITGRITADAKISKLTDGREVTGFTLVHNDNYQTKSGDKKQVSTFLKCSYWITPKVADYLKKGAIITVYGRIGLDVYKDQQGEAKGSLTFHVNDIKFIAKPAAATTNGSAAAQPTSKPEATDDLPF